MRFLAALPIVAAAALSLHASRLLAQAPFQEAHARYVSFWSEANNPSRTPAQRVAIEKSIDGLPGQLTPLITAGILDDLNGVRDVSTAALTMKIAQTLSVASHPVRSLADAESIVAVAAMPASHTYAIAYDIATCACCTTSWLGIVERRGSQWTLVEQIDNPAVNDAVHLAWIGSNSQPMLALYGFHFGDAHNRLDLRMYSVNGELREAWSLLDLYEGDIEISHNRVTLNYWTAPREPYQIKHQSLEAVGGQLKLIQTTLSAIQR